MILTVNIGNTNISVGLYSLDSEGKLFFTVACDRKKSDDEYVVILKNLFDLNGFPYSEITGSIIGSVVPGLTEVISRAVWKLTAISSLVVGAGIKTSLDIKTDRPGEVGSDIVANTVAALKISSSPSVVVDFGTATTIVGINKKQQLTDVFILPGIVSSLNALIQDAAEIPCVPLFPPKYISGKNTGTSVNTGIVYGNAFAVDGFIDWFRKEYSVPEITAVATGGMGELIIPFCRNRMIFNSHLTNEGLYSIYLKNCTN